MSDKSPMHSSSQLATSDKPDVAAIRSQARRRRLVTVTLIQGVPWTIRLCFSLLYFRRLYPGWLYDWLVISYSLLFIGQIRACGYLIFSDRNRSELLAIKSCSAKRIPSCRRAMKWCQTLRISCCIWRPPPPERSSHEVRTANQFMTEAPDWSGFGLIPIRSLTADRIRWAFSRGIGQLSEPRHVPAGTGRHPRLATRSRNHDDYE
jgi:hypothetical protein